MSKTLGQIIAVGAAIAVTAFPGVGLALGGILTGFAFSVPATIAIGQAITLGITAYGLQAGSSLLGLGPNIPKPDTLSTPLKQPRPPRVSSYGIVRLYGAYALFETSSSGTAVDVFAVHDGKIEEVIGYYLNDDPVTLSGSIVNTGSDGRYAEGSVNLYTTDGSTPGAGLPAIAGLVPDWTSNHRGDGVVLLAMTARSTKASKFLDIYPNQAPLASIVVKAQRCPDPRVANWSDPSTWTWTENAVRHLLHYKLVREGVDPATKITPTLAYWIAAVNDADSAIPLKAGGTEPRYRSCLSHRHTDAHKDVTAALLTCFDGWISPRADGALVVYSGAYYPPTVAIGPEQIVSYSWDGVGVDDDRAVNEIICGYVSAEHDYNTVETDAWTDEDDIAARGQVLSNSLDAQVPSWGQARRLAKRKMARTNALNRGTVTTNVAGRVVRGHRYINLHIEEAGATFYSGPVEITALTRNMGSGGVTFSWIAADPTIDAWNPATEEGDPAAKGDRIGVDGLAPPVIDEATPDYGSDSGAGSTGVFLRLIVTAPDRDDLTWFVRTREQGATVWGERQYTDIDPGASVELVTEFVPADSMIEAQVAYQVGDGRLSPWSASEIVDTSTSGVAPATPTIVSATGGTGSISTVYRNPTNANLAYTRYYRGTTATYSAATLVGGNRSGALGADVTVSDTGLAAGTYYVFVRAFNSAGAGSPPASAGPITVS